jgi:hypothetical protein
MAKAQAAAIAVSEPVKEKATTSGSTLDLTLELAHSESLISAPLV